MVEVKAYLNELLKISQYFALMDYLVLVAIFLVILLIFLVSVAFRFKSLYAFIFFFISGVVYFGSPFIFQFVQEKFLKTIEFNLTHNEKLQYDEVYFVGGSIKNIGKLDLKGCMVQVNFIPKNIKKIDKIRHKLRPKNLRVKEYKNPLKKGESMEFEIVLNAPNKEIAYELETKGACY